MGRSPIGRALLIGLIGATAGCVSKPPEKPIVLRPPYNAHRTPRAVSTPRPHAVIPSTLSAPVPPPTDSSAVLTDGEKKALFQDFDQYLANPELQP